MFSYPSFNSSVSIIAHSSTLYPWARRSARFRVYVFWQSLCMMLKLHSVSDFVVNLDFVSLPGGGAGRNANGHCEKYSRNGDTRHTLHWRRKQKSVAPCKCLIIIMLGFVEFICLGCCFLLYCKGNKNSWIVQENIERKVTGHIVTWLSTHTLPLYTFL